MPLNMMHIPRFYFLLVSIFCVFLGSLSTAFGIVRSVDSNPRIASSNSTQNRAGNDAGYSGRVGGPDHIDWIDITIEEDTHGSAPGEATVDVPAANAGTIKLTGSESSLVAAGTETPWTYETSPDGVEVVSENAAGDRSPVYLYLNVKDELFTDGNAPVVEFSFEYFDESMEEVTFSYDSNDPLYGPHAQPGIWKGGGGFQLMDTGTWKKKTIVLKDVRFSNRINGQDLRFRLTKHDRLRLRNITMEKLDQLPELPSVSRKQKEAPNILMIILDDLNDYVGAFGDPNAKTPNLDSFSNSALRFNEAYCQYPVCGPSRASFLSGLYPGTSGVLDNNTHLRALRPDSTNMLEYFKNSGYWTASAGKVFHSATNFAELDLSTYASDWFRNAEDPWRKKLENQFVREVGPIRDHREAYKSFMQKNFVNPERNVQAIATDMKDEDHRDGRTATRVASYLEEKPFGERPFFIACGFAKPHVPFFAPKKYFDLYPQDELDFEDVPTDAWANKPQAAMFHKYKDFRVEFGENDREVRAEWLQAYLACVSYSDAMFGRVMDALERSGLAENTIVVVFGDHGYHIGEHFLYGKATLFQESTRVPFMMRLPGGMTAGQATDSLAELLDIYPTLTELSGLKTPEHVQGRSLVPILKDPAASVRDSAYTVVTRRGMVGQSVRYKDWRYAEWGSPEQAELYDLEKDPLEHTNLANNPEYEAVVRELSEKILTKGRLK